MDNSLEQNDRAAYIASHIDEAIAQGWVILYFQPVIRTLSGKICSGEALARWQDPKYGMISPGEFVPVLEERGLSYKLAEFVIDETCGLISSAERMGMYPIPVSINLSRRDFEEMDPFEKVEEAVKKYGISRNLLCIEITESTAMENPEKIRGYMDRFHQAGYEVWMDDFGSAYSSLNVLKDFDFDEIKLDMAFMQNFNEKAKKIVANCINMAKDIGIHTLCEGVETREQVEFLRDYGCEKIQGFYYSRPFPLADLKEKIDRGEFDYERSVERFLYDDAGKIKLDPDAAGALLLYRNEIIYPLQISAPLREIIANHGIDLVELRRPLEMKKTDFGQKLVRVISNSEISGKQEEIAYFLNGHYYVLTSRMVTRSNVGSIFAIGMQDITESARGLVLKDAGTVAQTVMNLYDCIYRVDLLQRRISVVLSNFAGEMVGKVFRFDPKEMSVFIYWKDRDRFIRWIAPEHLQEELWEQGKRSISDIFRIEKQDGSRIWEFFTIIRETDQGENEVVLCMKPSLHSDAGMSNSSDNLLLNGGCEGHTDQKQNISEEQLDAETAWNTLLEQNALKIFWKDRERRFVGASRSFLDYFGLGSANEIIGKTDEECFWHVDDRSYEETEEKILKTGDVSSAVPGRLIVNGVIRNVLTTKFPIYRDGRVIGLEGIFIDADDVANGVGKPVDLNATKVDPVTGTMTFEAWVSELAQYEDNYNHMEEDFWIGVLTISNYWKVYHEFGQRTAEEMARITANTIRAELPESCVIGRAEQGTFMIVTKEADANLREHFKNITAVLSENHYIDAFAGRIAAFYAVTSRSEASNPIRMIGLALEKAEKSEILKNSSNERSPRGTGAVAGGPVETEFTHEEIQQRINGLLQVFDFVRLSDPTHKKIIRYDKDGTMREQNGNCFDIWGVGVPCDNCISARTLATKESLTKFETDGENVYIVTSKYVSVDGNPCVMEMVLKMDDSSTLGSDERGAFIRTLANCRARVYEDGLTGIHNRRYYEDLMADSIVSALAVIDIDSLQEINLTYGHIAGDKAVKAAARAISSCVRYHDLVKYDGDRFLIGFENIGQEAFEERIDLISKRLEEIHLQQYPLLKVSASICGVLQNGRIKDLLEYADRVLSEEEREESGRSMIVQP